MEQQVNLYQPIFRAEKRLFSARAIVVGLALLAISLGLVAGFAAWRVARAERELTHLTQVEAARAAEAQRLETAARPKESVAELEAGAKQLALDIQSRERALSAVRRAAAPGAGFAQQLESLAHASQDGVWLKRIILSAGEGRLGLDGAALDRSLVPAYLAAIAHESALSGARIDEFALRRAEPGEAPAQVLFRAAGGPLAKLLETPDPDTGLHALAGTKP